MKAHQVFKLKIEEIAQEFLFPCGNLNKCTGGPRAPPCETLLAR